MVDGRITFPLPSGICAIVGFGLAALGSFVLAIALGTGWSFGLVLHLLLVALVGYMLAMRCTENGNELFGLVALLYVPQKREELVEAIGRLPEKAAEATRSVAERVEQAIGGQDSTPAPTPAKGEPAAEGTRPPLLDSAPPSGGDDLTLINGIGPKLAGVLNGLGIHHFSQIANWSSAEIDWVDGHLGTFRGRARRDDWTGQAAALMRGAPASGASQSDAPAERE